MEAIKLEPAELGTVFVINKILATYEEINGSVIDDEEIEAEMDNNRPKPAGSIKDQAQSPTSRFLTRLFSYTFLQLS